MPLNSSPGDRERGRRSRPSGAPREGQLHVDVGFWGGVVPGNAPAIGPLAGRGVLGFKSFLCPVRRRRVPARGRSRPAGGAAGPGRACDIPLLVHAELPALLREPIPQAIPRVYRTWLETRPVDSEVAAIDLLIELARESGARIHVVHLSSPAPLAAIRARARERRGDLRARPARTT